MGIFDNIKATETLKTQYDELSSEFSEVVRNLIKDKIDSIKTEFTDIFQKESFTISRPNTRPLAQETSINAQYESLSYTLNIPAPTEPGSSPWPILHLIQKKYGKESTFLISMDYERADNEKSSPSLFGAEANEAYYKEAIQHVKESITRFKEKKIILFLHKPSSAPLTTADNITDIIKFLVDNKY